MGSRPLTFRAKRPHYECLVSVCIHDEPQFFADQVRNINEYVPDCCIVVHVNSADVALDENALPPNVWINPRWVPITTTHTVPLLYGFVSNVVYAYEVARFDRVLFLSGSTLFFRRIRWATFPKSAVCVSALAPAEARTSMAMEEARNERDWWWPHAARDPRLLAWMAKRGLTRIGGGQLSGTLVPEAAMADVIDLTAMDSGVASAPYPLNELYIQTVGVAYAAARGEPLFAGVVLTQWMESDFYCCRDASVFEAARRQRDRYALCKIHPKCNPAMDRFRALQAQVAEDEAAA